MSQAPDDPMDALSVRPASHQSHPPTAALATPRHPRAEFMNPSQGKRVAPVPYHDGMTDRQVHGALNARGGLAAPVEGAAHPENSPLAAVPPGKSFSREAPAPAFGARHRGRDTSSGHPFDVHKAGAMLPHDAERNKQLGRKIIEQALDAGSIQDRLALAPRFNPK